MYQDNCLQSDSLKIFPVLSIHTSRFFELESNCTGLYMSIKTNVEHDGNGTSRLQSNWTISHP